MKRTRPRTAKRPLVVQWARPTEFKIPIPKDEPQRLADLQRYQILDTLPEDEFDDLTALASQICHTPIALISLVDSGRQWFKSNVGLSFSETSRDIAFCAHAIMQHDLFIVPDASKDKRFTSNPLVTSDPKIRFYAGAPLVSPDDHALGTLCVLDRVPRELTSGQKTALRTLSRAIMTQLDLRRRLCELEEQIDAGKQPRAATKKRPRRIGLADRSPVGYLRKAAHEIASTADAIVSVTQRALLRPCTPEQHDLLKTARSGAGSLIALAREMKQASQNTRSRATARR
jgi:hypothetical protein